MSYKLFNYNNVRFKILIQDFNSIFKGVSLGVDFFDVPCKITLDISGSGLEYLRSINSTIEDQLTTEDLFGYVNDDQTCDDPVLRAHVTRCDFAYDFVNCHNDNFREMFSVCSELQLKGIKLIPCIYSNAASSYSIRMGSSENTLYLGKTNSHRLLRIYDKFLERTVKDKKYNHDNLYFVESEKRKDSNFELKSWWRIEYQLRYREAGAALYGCGNDLWRVFRDVCTRYCLAYPKHADYQHMKPIKCFNEAFNFDGLSQIGLNNHFSAIPTASINDSIESHFHHFVVTDCLIDLMYPDVIKVRNEFIRKCYYSERGSALRRRYYMLLQKLSAYMMYNNIVDIEKLDKVYFDSDGCLQFREKQSLSLEEETKILQLWRIDAAENKAILLEKSLNWYRELFDSYVMKCGGLSWNKNMIESITEVTERLGFDARCILNE